MTCAPFLRFYLHLRTVCAFLRMKKSTSAMQMCFFQLNPPTVNEIASRGERRGGFNFILSRRLKISSELIRISSRSARFHYKALLSLYYSTPLQHDKVRATTELNYPAALRANRWFRIPLISESPPISPHTPQTHPHSDADRRQSSVFRAEQGQVLG